MKNDILEIIDFEKVDALLEGFNKNTGFVTAILDLEGNVLSKAGWRQICIDFHRVHPETAKKCTVSDTELANKIGEGEKYHFYKCLNGLVDVAVPIVFNGEHIANLFSGQFFFEEPDISFFQKQAKEFGFDENTYLEALKKVPVVSKEKVILTMDFLLNLTQLITEMTYQKQEQIKLNNTVREREEKFKSVFESANVGKSITLPSGEINPNEALCNMLGYAREELQNKKWQDVTFENEIPDTQRILEPLLKGEKDSARFDKKFIRKDGSLIWADVSTSIRRDNSGNPLCFITTVIDITERKRLEEGLKSSEELFERAFHAGPAGMTITRIADGIFIDANKSFCELFEFDRDEVIGHTSVELNMWSPEERKRLIQQQIATEGLKNFELVARSKSGRPIHLLFSSKQLDLQGEACHITTMIDITDRKHAEEMLRLSQLQFRTAQDMSPDGFTILQPVRDDHGHIVDFAWVYENAAVARLNGTDLETIAGKRLLELFPGHRGTPILKAYLEVAESGEVRVLEVDYSGESLPKPISLRLVVVPMEGNIAILAQDITERKQLEIERRKFFLLSESSSEFIGMCDLDLQPFYVNPAGRRMVGLPDMAAACRVKVPDYFFPEDQRFIAEEFFPRVLREGHGEVEIRLRHFQTGEPIWMFYYLFNVRDANGEPVGWATVSRDITESRHAQEEIRQQLDELQRWYKVTIGRESRIMEIKQEVNELLVRLGESIRYPNEEKVSDTHVKGEDG